MNYLEFKYIYPPRPETKSPASALGTFERMGFIAQAKLNGSCGLLFTDGKVLKFMSRHADSFSRELIPDDILLQLHRGQGWTVLVGEFMNKSQRDSKGRIFNGNFAIHDILVYESRYLLGMPLQERQELLDVHWPETAPFDNFIHQVGERAYRIKNLRRGFAELWKEVTKVQMYEGFVLKRPDAPLDHGFRPTNNTGWQLKIRKPTKNYSF